LIVSKSQKQLKRQQIRFVFKYNNELFKFFSIFASNDNSFHFHLYEESNKPFKYYITSTDDDGRLRIDMKNPVSSDFVRHKFTFHKSGYIHSTKKTGERYKDGVRGIQFQDIKTSNLILILAPRKIELLEKYTAKNDGHNFIVPIEKEQSPFTFNIEVFKKSSLNKLPDIPIEILQGPFTYHWEDLDYGLRFYFQKVNGTVEWPKSTLILKRIVK